MSPKHTIILIISVQDSPKAAFSCLSQAATVYSRNPRLLAPNSRECDRRGETVRRQMTRSRTVKAIRSRLLLGVVFTGKLF